MGSSASPRSCLARATSTAGRILARASIRTTRRSAAAIRNGRNREQPFRSQPRSLALTIDGKKLYVTLPGREGYPDWRLAVVSTKTRQVTKWLDLRPPGLVGGLRPISVKMAPINTLISRTPYAVVLNQYSNFATVINTSNDAVLGDFLIGTYAEKARFNATGTRLYVTDRFKDEVRVFRVDPGPKFFQTAEIPTGSTELERTNPRDLDLSADGKTLYVANTLGHTIAVIDVNNDANKLIENMPLGGLATDVKISGKWGIVCGQETNYMAERAGDRTRAADPRRKRRGDKE